LEHIQANEHCLTDILISGLMEIRHAYTL